MRRSALLGTLLLLSGCSGLGHFYADTERLPGANPNGSTGVSENLQRASGRNTVETPILPEGGNIWPGPPQPLPTLSDVARNGGAGGAGLGGNPLGATMPQGGSMSIGQQQQIHDGVPLDQGFAGGNGPGALESSIPDPSGSFRGKNPAPQSNGDIVIPNGDGTSTVITPDGAVHTVKTAPK